MAKKATKKPAAPRRAKAPTGQRSGATKRRPAKAKSKVSGGGQSGMSAADALVGLLESPLVAEVIAAGAAAALATITQQALSKKSGGSKTALKEAARAAAVAMGTRLATEFDEIVKSVKETKSEKA